MKKLIFAAFLLWANVCAAEVVVKDGDSLEVDGVRVRLDGIDAPEFLQTCEDKNGADYECGQEALQYLQELIADKEVRCDCAEKADKFNRQICECFAGEKSLNREMVQSGWARTYRDDKFAKEEDFAEKHKRGIWQGRHMRPALYRVLHRYEKK